jgi:polyisoprenoid-binding protein YceI
MKALIAVTMAVALVACSKVDHSFPSAAEPTAAAHSQVEVPAGAYTLDRSHASLIFRVNHLGFSNYTARFKQFDAQLQFDPAHLEAANVMASVDARSIETDFPDPAKIDFNAYLQGEQWLDAARYPQMTFRSTKVELTGPDAVRISGEFTLRGVTRPLTLEAKFNGGYAGHPMDPHARIGFSAHGSLKRADFGMSFGIPQPGSTMGVGDNVDIVIEAEFSGPPWAGAPAA